jgi:pilus assembly protein CpaE
MVYSSKPDPDLLVRCMRAGAREFLTPPFAHRHHGRGAGAGRGRRPARPAHAKKTGGKLLVFLGAKGGAGVTTLACNFAVALAQDSRQSTLLIDLDLPLGDAALNLGIVAEYSTINALQDAGRLDASFLEKLLVKHSSGVSVLAAPGKFPQFMPATSHRQADDGGAAGVRQRGGRCGIEARPDRHGSVQGCHTIYLVTQAGIPELRNSNRLISQFFNAGGPKLEIVINRYEPRALGVSDEHITKALTRPAQWKIPNDYAAVRQMQNTATPLALGDSPISRLIKQMARPVAANPNGNSQKERLQLIRMTLPQ